MTVNLNLSRLNYLLDLYKLSDNEFLDLISKNLKKGLKKNEIFNSNVKLDHLKRIDSVFNKGLSYYLDPSDPIKNNSASIFFRKSKFNSDLNLKSKKIVNEFEDLKFSISAISKLADIDQERKLPILTINDNPRLKASEFRKKINYSFIQNQKDFITSLINKLGNQNILVFEFVETWNQKDRANIDGVFINPNVIVLKRQDGFSYKREIFTLAHEFAHYLLNIEEIEKLDYEILSSTDLNEVENWCNNFAYYFLIAEYESLFENLTFADSANDYNHETITDISKNTHLSELALFTRLLFNNKIDYRSYSNIKIDLENKANDFYEKVRREREEEKAKNPDKQDGGSPQPIKSEFLISTIQTAFYEGVIDEYEVCKALRIRPEKIRKYIQW